MSQGLAKLVELRTRKRRAVLEVARNSSTESTEPRTYASVEVLGFDLFDENTQVDGRQPSHHGVFLVDNPPDGPLVVALGTPLPASRRVVCVGSEPCRSNPFIPSVALLGIWQHTAATRRPKFRRGSIQRWPDLVPTSGVPSVPDFPEKIIPDPPILLSVVPFVQTTKVIEEIPAALGVCRTDECVYKDGRQVTQRHERVVFECSSGCRFLQHATCFRRIQKTMQSLISRKSCVTPQCDGLLFRASLLDDCGMVTRKFVDDKSAMECLRKIRRDLEAAKVAALAEAAASREEMALVSKERQRARRVERLQRRRKLQPTTPPRRRDCDLPKTALLRCPIQTPAPKRVPTAPPSRSLPLHRPSSPMRSTNFPSYALVVSRGSPTPPSPVECLSSPTPSQSPPSSNPSTDDSSTPTECIPPGPPPAPPLLPLASGSGLTPVPVGVAPPPTLPPRPPPPEAVLLLQGLLPPSWMVSPAVPIRLRKFAATIKSVLIGSIETADPLGRYLDAARHLSKQAESLLSQVEHYEQSHSAGTSTTFSICSTRINPTVNPTAKRSTNGSPPTATFPPSKTSGGLVHINRRSRPTNWRLPPQLLSQAVGSVERNALELFDEMSQVFDDDEWSSLVVGDGRSSIVLTRLSQRKTEF